MRVFVTGASGFIGSAVVSELLKAGHSVLGLVRSDASAKAVEAAGATAHRGDLTDLESLKRGAASADGVIHTAFIHDFAKIAASGAVDKVAVETIGEALVRTGKPFVVTSATSLLPPGRVVTEADVADPKGTGGHRAGSEPATLSLAEREVRSSLVRLPPSVHGENDWGFVRFLVDIARKKGVSAYIAEGRNRWPAVHRLDAAHLYRLALENGKPGSVFHAIDDEGVPTRDIAEAIGRGLSLPVASKPVGEASQHFGWLASFFGNDNPTTNARTRKQLGWQPRQPGLLADLASGHYFRKG